MTGMGYFVFLKFMQMQPNQALKAVASPLDVSNRRMLRILRAACSRPLALRYVSKFPTKSRHSPAFSSQRPYPHCFAYSL